MNRLHAFIIAGIFILAGLLFGGVVPLPPVPKTNSGITVITNALFMPTEAFLTLSNRTFLKFGASAVVRVTDEEWSILTNQYRAKLITSDFVFYK